MNVQTAIQIWVFTAFELSPQKTLIRKCCLIHLKNSSIFHLFLYNKAISMAVASKLLVINAVLFYVLHQSILPNVILQSNLWLLCHFSSEWFDRIEVRLLYQPPLSKSVPQLNYSSRG